MMALLVLLPLLAGCAQPTPQVITKVETVVVEKEVPVEQKVVETVVVEKERVVEKKVVETVVVEKVVEKEVEKIVEREVTVEVVATPEPGTGGTFIVGRGGDSVILDSPAATDGESWRVVHTMVDTLTRLEGTSTKPIPWLAEDWSTEDNQTWLFNLREGVKFHDGNTCDCEAVKWNIDRWRDPDNEWRFGRAFEYYDYQFGEDFAITDAECLDEYTLQLTLASPSVVLLNKLPFATFGIHSPEAIMEQGDTYGTPAGTVVGTGRFEFVEWIPDDHITVKRNPNWWGGPPHFERIIFRSIPDNTARFAELQAGTVHQADLAQSDMPAADQDPNIQMIKTPALSTGYIAFQQCTPPFDDENVRWAIAHAINREALMEPFYGDFGQVATAFQPPAILGHNPNLPPIEYDPEKAKELLAEAGYPDGFETDFWYIPVIRGYFPDSKAIGEAIAIDLAKVGIKVNLKTEDWGAYLADRNEGKFPMWMLGWGSDNGDPDNYIGWHFIHPIGEPKAEDCYDNDALVQLLIDGAKELDLEAREQIYMEAEEHVYNDMARLPIVWVQGARFYRDEVKGAAPVVFRDWYEKMWLSTE
jgi:peptide/nickel transport system substrate-binding protein